MEKHSRYLYIIIINAVRELYELRDFLIKKKVKDHFDWELGTGQYAVGTAPSVDNTFGNSDGHYIYIGKLLKILIEINRVFKKELF